MLDHLSPQRRRLVLVLAGLSIGILLAVAASLALRAVDPAPVPQSEPGPVLLVPGYGGTGASLEPMAERLRAAGRTVSIVAPTGDGTGDLDDQAERLAEVAEQVRDQAGAASVDVVGYSAGGVVARLWVAEHGGAGMARRVVSLGAPQHGTGQAALGRDFAGGCPPACEQLVPDSDLLRRLNADDETPSGPQWVTLRSATDQVVTPSDSATLDGATLNLLLQDACAGPVDHAALATHPYTYATLDAALGTGLPRPPALAC